MVTTRRSINQPVNISCNNCRMTFRAENITPYTLASSTPHCVACGSSNTVIVIDDDSRWEAMARNFGLPNRSSSVEFIKGLWSLWDPIEYESFKDFVEDAIKPDYGNND